MISNPFPAAPDVLHIELEANTPGLVIRNFESAWGVTEEKLVFFENSLIGLVENVKGASSILIELLPKLDATRSYPWPSKEAFENAVVRLMLSPCSWLLRCESDADQCRVMHISDDRKGAIAQLRAALAYCARERDECPNFSAEARFNMQMNADSFAAGYPTRYAARK